MTVSDEEPIRTLGFISALPCYMIENLCGIFNFCNLNPKAQRERQYRRNIYLQARELECEKEQNN